MKLSVTLLGLAFCISYASAVNSIAEEAAAAAKTFFKDKNAPEALLNRTSLLIAEPYQLSRIDLHPPSRRMLVRTQFVGGMDYHARTNRLFWSEISTGRINSRKLAGRGIYEEDLVYELSPRQWRPRAIAVDYLTDKIYVLDTRGKKVHVFDLANKFRTVIFEGELNAPMDLAVDPEEAVMFIADGTRVLKFNMDGSELTAIVSHPNYHIKSVSLDATNKRIFWSDEAFHRIKSASYDGSDVHVLIKNQIGKDYSVLGPAQLSYHDGLLYFYDDVYRKISTLKVDGKGVAESDNSTMLYDRVDVRAVKVLNAGRQKRVGRNPCDDDNGGCEQLCLIAKKVDGKVVSKCACDVGKTLDDDRKRCL